MHCRACCSKEQWGCVADERFSEDGKWEVDPAKATLLDLGEHDRLRATVQIYNMSSLLGWVSHGSHAWLCCAGLHGGGLGDTWERAPGAREGADLAWFVSKVKGELGMPLVLKGILHPDDARRAVELGVDGVVVSTHGGTAMLLRFGCRLWLLR